MSTELLRQQFDRNREKLERATANERDPQERLGSPVIISGINALRPTDNFVVSYNFRNNFPEFWSFFAARPGGLRRA